MSHEDLLKAASEAAEHAYAPYSHFRVGCVLLLDNGQTVSGVNVENASYGLTICAERTAIFRAVAEYGPRVRVVACAITNLNGAASPPCGACRQVLAEFAGSESEIIFRGDKGPETVTLAGLLPYSFVLQPQPKDQP